MNDIESKGLKVDDFTFEGSLGSEGAQIEQVGCNHFKIMLGHPEGGEGCPNRLQFTIKGNARGNSLRLDVGYDYREGRFDEYFSSFSYDRKNWYPAVWEKNFKEKPKENTMLFEEFEEDIVYVGHQIPMSYEDVEEIVSELSGRKHVKTVNIGKSIEGRNIHRIVISGEKTDVIRNAHYFAQQHPGEHNAQWRMMGMIEWLLSDDAKAFREENECHFVLLMSPDSPSRGWYRGNTLNCDMNRTYLISGSDPEKQTHEAWVCQKDLEDIAGKSNLSTAWAMHTWGGIVETIMRHSEEMEHSHGPWTILRDSIEKNDEKGLCKPLQSRNESSTIKTSWGYGPYEQFGVTTFLCEGGGALLTKEENMLSGKVLIQSLADYFLEE